MSYLATVVQSVVIYRMYTLIPHHIAESNRAFIAVMFRAAVIVLTYNACTTRPVQSSTTSDILSTYISRAKTMNLPSQ